MGKSMLALDLAAAVTTGRGFSDSPVCDAVGVVILPAEGDLEDTIRPRLEADSADSSRVICPAGGKVASGNAASASFVSPAR